MKIEPLLAKLAAPAQRALEALGISEVEDLSGFARKTIAELHGMGPKALSIIEKEMAMLKCGFLDRDEAGRAGEGSALVDAYISSFPEATQVRLREIRDIIRTNAPEAEEKIAYRMPTYFLNGNLVHFAGYDRHIGFYPTPSGISSFQTELDKYKNAKGSVQFPLDKPLPTALIRKIVRYRREENLHRKG